MAKKIAARVEVATRVTKCKQCGQSISKGRLRILLATVTVAFVVVQMARRHHQGHHSCLKKSTKSSNKSSLVQQK